jgi:hypothetical protein
MIVFLVFIAVCPQQPLGQLAIDDTRQLITAYVDILADTAPELIVDPGARASGTKLQISASRWSTVPWSRRLPVRLSLRAT